MEEPTQIAGDAASPPLGGLAGGGAAAPGAFRELVLFWPLQVAGRVLLHCGLSQKSPVEGSLGFLVLGLWWLCKKAKQNKKQGSPGEPTHTQPEPPW